MKTIIIFLSGLLLCCNTYSQAVLEHTYNGTYVEKPVYLEHSGWVYPSLSYSSTITEAVLYRPDHTYFKTIPLAIPSGYMFFYFINVSDHLFNGDNKVEILYSCVDDYWLTDWNIRLVNEDGALLQDFGVAKDGEIFQMDGDYKLITYTPSEPATRVYNLTGTMTFSEPPTIGKETVLVYPNPCTDVVHFILNDKNGFKQASIIQIKTVKGEILDILNVIGEMKVDYNVNNLAKGMYLFDVIRNEKVVYGGKFIVK